MRLNKYIAHSGVVSRRKADELIAQGRVKVNGAVAPVGWDVKEGDVVEVSGRVIKPEKKTVYYMLNKPVGYITTVNDDRGRETVLDLMPDVKERIYPVGRLDYNTSGLLILTNDGDLANRLMHPSGEVKKTYLAEVKGLMHLSDAEKLRKGVDIGDRRPTAPAEVEIIKQSESTSIVEIRIGEGRNRQVRRMFSAVGHEVIKLRRTAYGNLKLGHLKPGQYKKLSKNEIEYLKSL
ncbi:MAG: pseudouridine synthase [Anaerovoracaceae bacterium]|nr:pseudouridine synthase [Bacillota bacterium]MDY2670264.1 pseudouridine synthase [Anaerovoracaceae bacterium]